VAPIPVSFTKQDEGGRSPSLLGTGDEVARAQMPSRSLLLSLALMLATIAAGLAVRFAPLGLPLFVVKYGGSMAGGPPFESPQKLGAPSFASF
jgi:hypothetical protein